MLGTNYAQRQPSKRTNGNYTVSFLVVAISISIHLNNQWYGNCPNDATSVYARSFWMVNIECWPPQNGGKWTRYNFFIHIFLHTHTEPDLYYSVARFSSSGKEPLGAAHLADINQAVATAAVARIQLYPHGIYLIISPPPIQTPKEHPFLVRYHLYISYLDNNNPMKFFSQSHKMTKVDRPTIGLRKYQRHCAKEEKKKWIELWWKTAIRCNVTSIESLPDGQVCRRRRAPIASIKEMMNELSIITECEYSVSSV